MTSQNSKFFKLGYRNGFGLVEIVVVTAVVTTALFALLQAESLAVRLLRNEKDNLEATILAGEALEAVNALRNESWTQNILPLANGTAYYPIIENGKWKLSTINPGPINGRYTSTVIFNQVFRDAADDITPSGTLDSNTRGVKAVVSWTAKSKDLSTYITNFREPLGGPTEQKTIFFEDATTDADLANFPSNNSGDGDPAQGFTTLSSAIKVTKAELYLRRITSAPSNVYAEIRPAPTGTILGVSNMLNSATLATSSFSWVEFRFPDPIQLQASTQYYIRLRSAPDSTTASSGSLGRIHWRYKQTASSPYSGGEARRYIGRLSNPSDAGQLLDQYDFGFRIYNLP